MTLFKTSTASSLPRVQKRIDARGLTSLGLKEVITFVNDSVSVIYGYFAQSSMHKLAHTHLVFWEWVMCHSKTSDNFWHASLELLLHQLVP